MGLSDYETAIESFLKDKKAITYKFLSAEFKIHVNYAKAILEEYWKKHKEDQSLEASFLLIGQLSDNSIRVEVVRESNFAEEKKKFTKVDCDHLYSLQKSFQDLELFAFFGDDNLHYSAIKCYENNLRSDDEIDSLRYIGNSKKDVKTGESCANKKNNIPEKSKKTDTKQVSPTKAVKKIEPAVNEKKILEKEKIKNTEIISEEKGNTEKKVVSTDSNKANKLTKKPVQTKQFGFNNLFAKAGNVKNKDSSSTSEKKNLLVEKTSKVEQPDQSCSKQKLSTETELKDDSDSKKEKNPATNELKKTESKSKSKVSTQVHSRGKKRDRSQDNHSSSKRKRIIIAESSDEESDKSDKDEPMEEVQEEPSEPIRKRSPSPPVEKRENGKRLVRKTKDEIFKDEEGFLVTKRVHVYEAVTENETSEKVEKEKLVEKSKKSSSETNTKSKKQTSLMSFFQKR
ncbi:hypothetical protein TKK_0011432 [Trichogramma kaykai]|uniref:DNA polymerase delta subunit 3 n=1 Tax=Trichogramma kaykai TaxID=54128 RepID=A0ABD2WS35_9HYME